MEIVPYRAENKGASNVNDAPLLAFDAPNQNLTRQDDASLSSNYMDNINKFIQNVILTRQNLE